MSTGKLMSAGILSALAASLCCITPVLALIAGTGSLASSFSWIEPARPYMIGLTVLVLGFAWYLQLRPQPKDECGCVPAKTSFFQSKKFLLIITLLAGLMITFPSYAHIFFPKTQNNWTAGDTKDVKTLELSIKGMTCAACEEHVSHEVNKLPGIVHCEISYAKRNAVIQFDISKTTTDAIIAAVQKTGYKVINQQLKNKL